MQQYESELKSGDIDLIIRMYFEGQAVERDDNEPDTSGIECLVDILVTDHMGGEHVVHSELDGFDVPKTLLLKHAIESLVNENLSNYLENQTISEAEHYADANDYYGEEQ